MLSLIHIYNYVYLLAHTEEKKNHLSKQLVNEKKEEYITKLQAK